MLFLKLSLYKSKAVLCVPVEYYTYVLQSGCGLLSEVHLW